jgi:hypothetical protein
MARDPDASEWGMLKGYFAALADHDPAQERQPVEAVFDEQICRRFGDWIARSAGSRGVSGTRTIKKQNVTSQWRPLILIAKEPKLPIALPKQQPTRSHKLN